MFIVILERPVDDWLALLFEIKGKIQKRHFWVCFVVPSLVFFVSNIVVFDVKKKQAFCASEVYQ